MLTMLLASILSFWICSVTFVTRLCLKEMRKEKRLMEGEKLNEFNRKN